uniref:SFRICE_007659 n=1 Tax=Spodoptera frugiperda TaxID=7108 RepID=A0A2H1V454_SPOFR
MSSMSSFWSIGGAGGGRGALEASIREDTSVSSFVGDGDLTFGGCTGDLSRSVGDLSRSLDELSRLLGDLSRLLGELSRSLDELFLSLDDRSCSLDELSLCMGDLSRSLDRLSCSVGDLSRSLDNLSRFEGDTQTRYHLALEPDLPPHILIIRGTEVAAADHGAQQQLARDRDQLQPFSAQRTACGEPGKSEIVLYIAPH